MLDLLKGIAAIIVAMFTIVKVLLTVVVIPVITFVFWIIGGIIKFFLGRALQSEVKKKDAKIQELQKELMRREREQSNGQFARV